MKKAPPWLHFPLDIKLETSPLLETWLEIRWQLEPTDVPQLLKDRGFPFALGVFYKSIEDQFPHRENLGLSDAPLDLFPYRVRHRFQPSKNAWPLLQLGPGVASVNFTEPYTWDIFLEKAQYLRNKLLAAYGDTVLKTQSIALRYRNGTLFECGASNPLDFFSQNLNTSISLPEHIPGPMGSPSWPADISTRLTFNVLEPRGKGVLLFATGTRRREIPETNQVAADEMLLWQLELHSSGENAPDINDESDFLAWLTSAHAVLHDWFFSLIDGQLMSRYMGEDDQ